MTQRPKHAGLRHVALHVENLELVEKFYTDILGFELEWRPDDDSAYLSSGIDNLALHRVRGEARSGFQTLDHMGIIIDDIDEVSSWHEFMKANNVLIHNEPKTHRDGARSFYCADPEGNNIQVIFHPPISGK